MRDNPAIGRLLPFIAICGILLAGCETQDALSSSISVTPDKTNLRKNGTAYVTASGGWNYNWTLDDGSIGQIAVLDSSTASYRATSEGKAQVIYVTAKDATGKDIWGYAIIRQGNDCTVPNVANPFKGQSSGGSSTNKTEALVLSWDKSPPGSMATGEDATVSVKGYSSKANIEWTTTSDSGLSIDGKGTAKGKDSVVVKASKPSTGRGWSISVGETGKSPLTKYIVVE